MHLGSYLKVNDTIGQMYCCVPEDEPSVDAGVSDYIASGCTRDRLLYLTLLEGPALKVLASQIASWFISTPESRERTIIYNLEAEDEELRFKRSNSEDWVDE